MSAGLIAATIAVFEFPPKHANTEKLIIKSAQITWKKYTQS